MPGSTRRNSDGRIDNRTGVFAPFMTAKTRTMFAMGLPPSDIDPAHEIQSRREHRLGQVRYARGQRGARFDRCNRRFRGFVWGENVGWINLNDAEHFVAIGPCDHGDFGCDGDVELDDYAAFENVFFGPNVAVECTAFDADADTDVDLFDFSMMQTVISVQ